MMKPASRNRLKQISQMAYPWQAIKIAITSKHDRSRIWASTWSRDGEATTYTNTIRLIRFISRRNYPARNYYMQDNCDYIRLTIVLLVSSFAEYCRSKWRSSESRTEMAGVNINIRKMNLRCVWAESSWTYTGLRTRGRMKAGRLVIQSGGEYETFPGHLYIIQFFCQTAWAWNRISASLLWNSSPTMNLMSRFIPVSTTLFHADWILCALRVETLNSFSCCPTLPSRLRTTRHASQSQDQTSLSTPAQ